MLHWLTTAPNPRYINKTHGADQGQRGWSLHAVEAPADATVAHVNGLRALCGLRAAHGWGLDLFIERRCTRCEAKANRLVASVAEGRAGGV